MLRSIFTWTRRPFGLGMVIGLLIGTGMLLGVIISFSLSPWSSIETRLEAVASSGSDSMAIATGPIGEGVEGLFVLDFITSELTCQMLNPRTGKLAGAYHRNVAADLGVEQGKQPKYLMLTGAFQIRQAVANIRPAESLVYVADINTSRYMVYMLPFNKQLVDRFATQGGEMIPVGGGLARNIALEK